MLVHMPMQGTNAHAILSFQPHGTEAAELAIRAPEWAWHRKRMWFCPPSLVLLQRSSASVSGTAQMQTRLSRAALALYHDHRVSTNRAHLIKTLLSWSSVVVRRPQPVVSPTSVVWQDPTTAVVHQRESAMTSQPPRCRFKGVHCCRAQP